MFHVHWAKDAKPNADQFSAGRPVGFKTARRKSSEAIGKKIGYQDAYK